MKLRQLLIASIAVAVLRLCPYASAQSNNQCDQPGESPDVITGDLVGVQHYGPVGDINAYAIGTTSCNLGTCWLNWISGTAEHPVIGQNMFRLKSGRFEQIGQAWLKHGFTALQGTVCSTSCLAAPDGTHLGVNCSDPYSSSLNGSQTGMGPKVDVNPYTGVFPYPDSRINTSGNAIFKRLQVHNADLDPALNAGALYWVEGQYVTHDDGTAGNGANNASYRPITVTSPSAGSFDIALTGTTTRQSPGIRAWKVTDPSVTESFANVPGDGLFIVSAKATSLGGGVYHYEYAVQNLNVYRAAQSFTVPIPQSAVITNVGFHDVDYHSGEPFDGTDWTPTVGLSTVSWSTQTYDQNPNANALRWGTLYNFRFDATAPPTTSTVTIGLFRPGIIFSISVATVVPTLCNQNGVCDAGETCGNCAADCYHQGGGSGCCGNGTCDAGENPCRCLQDCGVQTVPEVVCGNGVDDDCDGLTDCVDMDCCTSAACSGSDPDGDHYAAVCDCNNADSSVYPGAPQLCDGKNNDCAVPGWPVVPANEADADGDLVRVCGGDCNDADAGIYPAAPQLCDGKNNDCNDPGWPSVPANETDADADTVRVCGGDCDDANSLVWATPGEARALMLTYSAGAATLNWNPPLAPGCAAPRYDTLRSTVASDFMGGAVCLETDGTNTQTIDADSSAPGQCDFYLVRGKNDCPSGLGSAGNDSEGVPRSVRSCP